MATRVMDWRDGVRVRLNLGLRLSRRSTCSATPMADSLLTFPKQPTLTEAVLSSSWW